MAETVEEIRETYYAGQTVDGLAPGVLLAEIARLEARLKRAEAVIAEFIGGEGEREGD